MDGGSQVSAQQEVGGAGFVRSRRSRRVSGGETTGCHSESHPGGSGASQSDGGRAHLVVALLSEERLQALVRNELRVQLEAFEERLASQVGRNQEGSGASSPGMKLLSERELAVLLGCHPRTVRRLEQRGKLPRALRIGGSKRWREAEVVSWLDHLRGEGRRLVRRCVS